MSCYRSRTTNHRQIEKKSIFLQGDGHLLFFLCRVNRRIPKSQDEGKRQDERYSKSKRVQKECQTFALFLLSAGCSSLVFFASGFCFFFSGTLISSFSFSGARHSGQRGARFSDVITSIMHCWQKTCAQRVITGSTRESRHTEHSSSLPEDNVIIRSLMSRWVSWSTSSSSSSSESSNPEISHSPTSVIAYYLYPLP